MTSTKLDATRLNAIFRTRPDILAGIQEAAGTVRVLDTPSCYLNMG
jgi:hypothetical protein